MWFKKQNNVDPEQEIKTKKSKGDMRKELGIRSAGRRPSAVPMKNIADQGTGAGTNTSTGAFAKGSFNETAQITDLKIRARRRFIGAFVLLGAAFMVLPWLFDDDRKHTTEALKVSVPDQDKSFLVRNENNQIADRALTTKNQDVPHTVNELTNKDGANKLDASKVGAVAEGTTPATPASTEVAEVKGAENGKKYAVHVGIVDYGPPIKGLTQKLRAAGVEPVTKVVAYKGRHKIRVRLGIFDTRAEAEAALLKIKGVAKAPSVIEVNPANDK